MYRNPLTFFNFSIFLHTQHFILPVLLLFYQQNGLTVGDFFLFQGIFSITALLFEIPAGYIGDIFPRKNILILSFFFFLMRLFLWLFFAQYGYWIILTGEILYSMSKAFYSGVADGYVYDYLQATGKTKQMLKRYGRLNFFMSFGTAVASLIGAYFYGTFSQYTLVHWGKDYGFLILIAIEVAFNIGAVCLLFMLPNLPSTKQKVMSMSEKYRDLFHISKQALQNKNIKYHMFYSGMLGGTSMLFVWSFQPLMKYTLVPVSLFGLIYFINHLFRALASYFLHRTMSHFTLPTFSKITFAMFIISFLIAWKMAALVKLPVWISICFLIFICLTIGFQLTFTLAHVARIHTIISSDIRATVSSVNNMINRSSAGFFLILFKFLLDDVSMQTSFLIYLGIFLLSLYPLYKICSLSKRTPDPLYK